MSRLLDSLVAGDFLEQQEFDPVHRPVPGVFHEGLGLLVAEAQAGKTFLTCDLIASLGTGRDALGEFPVTPAPVLLVSLEEGLPTIRERLSGSLQGDPIPSSVTITDNEELDPTQAIPLVEEWFDQHRGRNPVAFLDTLAATGSAPNGNRTHDRAIGDRLKVVARDAPGASFVVIHHALKKPAKAAPQDLVNQQLVSTADCGMVLRPVPGTNPQRAELFVWGRRHPSATYGLIRARDGRWEVDRAPQGVEAAPESSQLGGRMEAAAAFVNGRSMPTEAAQLAEHLDIQVGSAARCLSRLRDAKRIRQLARGIYGALEPSGLSEAVGLRAV